MAIEISTYPKHMIIEYDDKTASMEFTSEEEGGLVKTILYSNEFWANFLNSLSAALSQHK